MIANFMDSWGNEVDSDIELWKYMLKGGRVDDIIE